MKLPEGWIKADEIAGALGPKVATRIPPAAYDPKPLEQEGRDWYAKLRAGKPALTDNLGDALEKTK